MSSEKSCWNPPTVRQSELLPWHFKSPLLNLERQAWIQTTPHPNWWSSEAALSQRLCCALMEDGYNQYKKSSIDKEDSHGEPTRSTPWSGHLHQAHLVTLRPARARTLQPHRLTLTQPLHSTSVRPVR